jgi:uncharacterized protein YukE
MTTPTRQDLLSALAAVIAHAPEKDRSKLGQTLQDYAYKYARSYKQMSAGSTMLAQLLDTIEEASDARIARDLCGLPDEDGTTFND